MDLLGNFYDFSYVSSFVRSTEVCSTTFRRDLLLQLIIPYNTISAVTALQAAAQLDVACPIFCVLRDEHLYIDRPVCPYFPWYAINSSCCCWLRLLYLCYTSGPTGTQRIDGLPPCVAVTLGYEPWLVCRTVAFSDTLCERVTWQNRLKGHERWESKYLHG